MLRCRGVAGIQANRSMQVALTLLVASSTACMSLSPQLHPTDIAALEQLEDREAREAAYIEHSIVRRGDFRGTRYTKGTRLGDRPRSWQSLDLILRSDRNSTAALPEKKIRAARVLTGFLLASSLGLVAGFSSSAREGLDLSRPTGTSAVLIGSGISTLAFAIAAGVTWNQARKGYDAAVDVYNDSLALRLGISDANGEYIPPPGVLVDEEGYIILDQKELLVPGNRPRAPTAAPQMPPASDGAPASDAVEGPAPDDSGSAPSLEGAPPAPVDPASGDTPKDAPALDASPPAAVEPESSEDPAESDGAPPSPGPSTSSLIGPSRTFR